MLFMMDGVKDRMKKVTEDKENRCALIYLRKHVVPSLIIGVPNIAVGMILAVKRSFVVAERIIFEPFIDVEPSTSP
jgi:hypothetical protein